jgi:SAM-dependent methyltransferase
MNRFSQLLRIRRPIYALRILIETDLFDWKTGCHTAEVENSTASACSQGDDNLDSVPHMAVWTSVIRRTLNLLENHLQNSNEDKECINKFIFLDLGSGLGKACLITRSEFSHLFQDIIGIEISSRLVNIARKNSYTMFGDYGNFYEGNVIDFPFLNLKNQKVVVFMYNPFGERTIQRVLGLLSEIEDLIVIYVNPIHEKVFLHSNYIRICTNLGKTAAECFSILSKSIH